MIKLSALLLLHVVFVQSYAQSNDSISNLLHNDLKQIYAQEHITGFSVAVVNEDGILFNKGIGYADKKGNRKYTANTIQNIASISKTFIGIALLKAEELGKLKLDDPINAYLPFPVVNPYYPNKEITVRQLANHTSSIKDPPEYEKKGYVLRNANNDGKEVNRNFRPPEEMMELSRFLENILRVEGTWYRKKNFLKKAPGEHFEYSNIAAGLAALVLEKATGESFHEFTKAYIFNPLNMADSGWFSHEVDFSEHSKLYAKGETELAPYQLINYPDGGLLTSSKDLGNYLAELISGYNGNGKILTKESYEKLFKPYLSAANFTKRNESAYNDEYNMGIFMGMSSKGQIGHTGGDPGVTTFMFFNTQTKIGKILMVNTDLDKEGVSAFIAIWKKLQEYENKL